LNATLTGNETGLVDYYQFNQGIAGGTNTGISTLFDSTVTANNGTISNFALNGNTSNFVTGYFAQITGASEVNAGSTIQLSHPVAGGTWSSSSTGVATVSSTGLVTGVTAGTTTITYTVCSNSTTKVITVLVSDSDGDGVLDNQEVLDGTSPTNSCDFVVAHRTLAPSTAWNNADCDNDGIPNEIEGIVDTDNDGTPDFRDLDSDNDGITDAIEKGNGTTPRDTDNDGTPDYRDLDSDNDGITDAIEKGNGTTPRDTDNDGTPDYRDLDSDNDGITDAIEKGNGTTPRDTDNDGTPDYRDLDSDNDGITDAIEKGNGTTPLDTDNDGTPDYRDLDSDNDGITDALEKGSGITPLDADNDGIPDFRDLDADNDGIADNLDNCPITANANQADNDHDGQGDVCDTDDDNDGVLDTNDNCPITANTNQADRDHDGKGDVCDLVELNVAQAITPNGDGVNDTWVIYNIENHPGSIVRVFNRWGNEVYYSNNYHNDWDGHYKNLKEGLPSSGAYMYQIDLNGDGTIDAQGWLYITN
jgi:gliding motility-associated-like protein